MCTIFKVFIEFVTILLLLFFIFWFFNHEACGILAPGMRDRLCISCIVRWSLNHWTIRDILSSQFYEYSMSYSAGYPGGSVIKNLLPIQEPQETWVWSLGQEDPLEEEMATHSSILVRIIPWTEESGGL